MRPIKQFLFWFITILILVALFGKPYGGYTVSFYFVSFLLPVIIGTSYIFNSFLVPNYLLKKRYVKFGIYTFYTIIISLNLEMLIIFLAFAVLANYEYNNMVPAATNIFGLAITMYFVVLVKTFMLLAKSSLSEKEIIQSLEEKQSHLEKGYLIVRADRRNIKVLLEDILYIESLSDYVKINAIPESPIITKEKISVIEHKLASPFIRIHRSFIINADKIDSFTSDTLIINGNELPISRTYKKEVREYLTNKQ